MFRFILNGHIMPASLYTNKFTGMSLNALVCHWTFSIEQDQTVVKLAVVNAAVTICQS
jgi:hypothetical protein